MDIEFARSFLGWCSLVNIGILFYWLLMLKFAGDWVFRHSNRWVSVSEQHFNAMHFGLLGAFKLSVIFFNIVPYGVLSLM